MGLSGSKRKPRQAYQASQTIIGKAVLFSQAALLVILTSFANPAMAYDDTVSGSMIDRVGLTVEWFTNSGIGASGELVDWHLNVNEDKATTFFTIDAGKYHETYSQNKIDAFGKPMGIDGGVKYFEYRKEILEAEFENEGMKDVKIVFDQYVLPETSIYTLASNGMVRALDGDTGKLKWSTQIGNPRLPSIGIGSNDNFVAAVNGSEVYCLEASTGKLLWSSKCHGSVASSPVIGTEKIFVPLTSGRLEGFKIKDLGISSSTFVVNGEVTARPVLTELSIAWPNRRGQMSVAALYGGRGVDYQLNSNEPIISSPAWSPKPIVSNVSKKDEDEPSTGTYFVTSLDGFVYAIDEKRGTVIWQVSTGRGISQSPVLQKGFVFVINDNRELFKLRSENGKPADGWIAPRSNIETFLGASQTNLYVLDRFGALKVVSQDTGSTLGQVNFGGFDKVLTNTLTDRIYVASKRGVIRCIRERSQPIPHFHDGDFGPAPAAIETAQMADAPAAKMTDEPDPFAESDPFDEKAEPAAEVAADMGDEPDPFAETTEPAAASTESAPVADAAPAADDDDDPFK
jgi:hypothetical protein